MSLQRHEFCALATQPGTNLAELCRRHGVSRKTAYKWIGRYRRAGADGMQDRSRRPARSPGKIDEATEQRIVALRRAHPHWCGRKLRQLLLNLGEAEPPAASTIQQVIARNGLLVHRPAGQRPWVRFEHPAPNDLWQIDFKGHFALGNGGRCHPLSILDDHSRFCLALRGCDDERGSTVQHVLQETFERYGLPRRVLCDNGAPWGDDAASPHTQLTIWLLRLGVAVSHGRAYHPQTQGKCERFHRTLNVELIGTRCFADRVHFQSMADPWRDDYNLVRPHEGIGLRTPATRYRVSARRMPAALPAIEYDSADRVRTVDASGRISFRGRQYKIGRALIGQPVALRARASDDVMGVFFCHVQIKELDLRSSGD